ncbi:MAG: response regulator [Desulfuromusa sp.]|nr:response regulator [Desulfuromusa sp.]
MNRKSIYRLIVILMALAVAGTFMLCDLGLGLTPLTKFFVIFSGLIIGMQSIPAFIGTIKSVSTRELSPISKSLGRNGDNDMKARKILIADKDSVARKELAEFFENSHFEVETTASAAYAIAKIVQKHEPIVILGDSFEEKIASVDVIALMRKCNKDLRIILVSDDSSLETLRRIREDGIFFHALKPHNQEDNEELRSEVECAVESFQPVMN